MIATCPNDRPIQAGDSPILIVDDDAEIRELIGQILNREGFTTVDAGDGRTALALALKRRPALVILDLRLPDSGGAVVASRLQGTYGRSIPILVVSAEPEAADIATHIGALACLSKPFDVPALLKIVRSALVRGVDPWHLPSATSLFGRNRTQ